MKPLLLFSYALLLSGFRPPPSCAQDRTTYLVTNRYGQTRTWMLPADWRPSIEDGSVHFINGSSIHVGDLLAIRPKRDADTLGYHRVDAILLFANGRSTEQTFWVPDMHLRLEEFPRIGDFRVLDDRTWIRADAYHLD
ncbi:MAG: hypothetical protein IPL52_04765 [Flavobacteriales bacterium]|nr:hypothetical protein [Flavobacteriales bacterium]